MKTKSSKKRRTKRNIYQSPAQKTKGISTVVSDAEKYRDLFHRASAAIFIIESRVGKIIDCNQRFYEILGIPKSPQPSLSVRGLKKFMDPVIVKEICREVLQKGKYQKPDISLRTAINTKIYCDIDAAIVMDGGKKVIQVIMRDVTRRKQLLDELESATRELEEQYFNLDKLSRMQNEFYLNLANKIQTPIQSILDFTDILCMEGKDLFRPEHQMQLKAIRSNAQSVLNWVNNLLDWSKINCGKLELEREKINLMTLLQDIKDSMRQYADEKNLVLKTKISKDMPDIYADPKRLRQIIMNLVSNALKFTDKGYISLHIDAKQQHYIELSVEDTGSGIHPSTLNTIFEPFQTYPKFDLRYPEGSGLGLSITKKLVELHKGEIDVFSEPGKGSKFIVRLPIQE